MANKKDKQLTFDEPLPDETNKAFEYFQTYLQLGIDRSYRKVAETYGISQTAVNKFADRYFWTERVRLYNSHMAQIYRKEMEEEARKANKRHVKQAKMILDKAVRKIRVIKPEKLTPDQALKYLELSVRMERDALGIADLNKNNETTVNVNNNFNLEYGDEDLKAIEQTLYHNGHFEESGGNGEEK